MNLKGFVFHVNNDADFFDTQNKKIDHQLVTMTLHDVANY